MASPLKIMIGLHYWTTSGEYDGGDTPHWESPAAQDALKDFVNGGLLRRTDTGRRGATYEATDALEVWVKGLCEVPWPVQKWVLPTYEN